MSKKRGVQLLLVLVLLVPVFAESALASGPSINNISFQPQLDIAYFNSYNITANVTNTSPIDTVAVNVSIINGDGNPCGQFYPNGSCAESGAVTYNMTYVSQDIWRQTTIRPDNIYPQIEFALDTVYWRNLRQNITITKENFHLIHYINNYTSAVNMSFWVEFDATPMSVSLSKDLVIYIIEHGHNISFFQGSDWRNNAGVELVATYTPTSAKSHTHTANSSHYLVTLTANPNSTIGIEQLNVSGDFWVAIYSNAPANQGWYLGYRNDTLCNNTGLWYREQQGGWSTTPQSGCPDAHTHVARSTNIIDGVRLGVTANYTDGNSTTNTTNVTFGPLPNLPPLATAFIYPQNGTYSGLLNITWIPVSDPNGDPITYNLSLLNADGTLNRTLNTSTNLTYFYWNSSTVLDGVYDLMIVACDTSNACTNFTLGGLYDNFTVDNTPPVVKLLAPANGTSSPVNAYNFTFNVTDLSEISSCILIFNNSVINTLTTVYRNAQNNFSNASLPLGTFNWSVNCTDAGNNTANSGNFALTITPLYNFTNISLAKTDNPDPVEVGNLLNYTINVTSTGNGTAYSVVVNDSYPGAVTYVNASPVPLAGTNNTWSLGNLTSGASVLINITVNVSLTVPNGTNIINSVNVSYQNETGSLLSLAVTAQTQVLNPLVLNKSNISVSKTDNPDPVDVNTRLNYTITVTSTGDATAYNVTLNETYPAQVIFMSAQPAPTVPDNYWVLGNLSPGTAIAVNISVLVMNITNNTIINNTANAAFNNGTGAILSRTATASTTVIVPLRPQIQLISPANNTAVTSSPTVQFSYNVSDASIQNCSLYINGILNQTSTSVTPNTVQTFNATLQNGNYNWSVSCINGLNLENSSLTYIFTMSYSPPAPSGGGGGGGSARSFYSYLPRRTQNTQTRQEETGTVGTTGVSQQKSSQAENTGKSSQSKKSTGITGSATREFFIQPLPVTRISVAQGISLFMLTLAIAGILGTVAITQYAYYLKPKVVVKLHRNNVHSDLVIMLKRHIPKKTKPSSEKPQ